MNQSGIYIKPSRRGLLRRKLHAKSGENLSLKDLAEAKQGASPATKKQIVFAANARAWGTK